MITLVNEAAPVIVVVEQRPPIVITPTANTGGGSGGGSGGVSPYESPVFPASLQWIINHNLGRKVDVVCYTTGSVKMGVEVVLISNNQAVANFSQPTAGYARVI